MNATTYTAQNQLVVNAALGVALVGYLVANPDQVPPGVDRDQHALAMLQSAPSWVKEAVILGVIVGSAKANEFRDKGDFWGCPDSAHAKMSLTLAGMGMSLMGAPL